MVEGNGLTLASRLSVVVVSLMISISLVHGQEQEQGQEQGQRQVKFQHQRHPSIRGRAM